MRSRWTWSSAIAGTAVAACIAAAPAPAVVLDERFGDDGAAVVSLPAGSADMSDLAVAPDGSFYAVVPARAGFAQGALLRFTPDGRLDARFGDGGIVPLDTSGVPFVYVASDTASRPIVLVPALIAPGVLLRFTPAGAPDPTFGTGGRVTAPVFGSTFATTPDGGILMLGSVGFGAGSLAGVVRLRADGALDTAFGTGGLARVPPAPGEAADAPRSGFDLEVDAAGRIVVARALGPGAGTALARLLADGRPDPAFGTGGATVAPRTMEDVAAGADGSVVYAVPTGPNALAIGRLTPSGAPDVSAGPGGVRVVPFGPTTQFRGRVFALPDGRAALLNLNILVVVNRRNELEEGFDTRAEATIPGQAQIYTETAVIDTRGGLVLNRRPGSVRLVRALLSAAPTRPAAPVRLSVAQLRINQRIAQAAVRRLNALEAAVTGVPAPSGQSQPGRVTLSVGQLLINQRIAQAAVRRANSLAARLEGEAPPASAPSGTGRVSLTATQLLISQRIAQAAVRRANALAERIPVEQLPVPRPESAGNDLRYPDITGVALSRYKMRINFVVRGPQDLIGREVAYFMPPHLVAIGGPRVGEYVSGVGVLDGDVFYMFTGSITPPPEPSS